jgi:hypothetical protein
VSSPNEPGQPGPGDSPAGGNGSVEHGGARQAPAANGGSGEVPPWQRGGARPRPAPAPQRPAESSARPDVRAAAAPAPPSSIEARVNRFITGTAAPDLTAANPQAPRPEARAERTEVARPEAYGSELPDLSGPKPPQPRKPAAEQPTRAAASKPRFQVSNRSSGPVRASVQLRHIDPWSALKVSLLLSVALFFVWMIAVAFLYLVLGGMGVWSKLNSNVGDLLTSTSGGGGELVSSGTIFGGAALIGLVNIVLLTAMATIGAFIYNLSTDIVGGIEVTLADRD